MKNKPRIFNLRGHKVTLTLVDNFDEEFPYQVVQHVAYPEYGPEAAVSITMSAADEQGRNATFQRYGYKHARRFIKETIRFFRPEARPKVLTSAERAKIQRRKDFEAWLIDGCVCQVCSNEERESFEFEEELLDKYPNGPTDEERRDFYEEYVKHWGRDETWICPNCSQAWGW